MSQPPDTARSQEEIVGALTTQLGSPSFGTGPLAELRRLDPKQKVPSEPALHRLLARHVPNAQLHADGLNRWTLLVHLLALAAPNLHRGGERLGRALFDATYSEGRLTRLLEASASDFPVVLPRMVRFLVAKGQRLHALELADLVLRSGSEHQRRQIAQHYYRAEAKTTEAA